MRVVFPALMAAAPVLAQDGDLGAAAMADFRDRVAQSVRSEAVSQAFNAARRAILRCQGAGYDLPVDAYGTWYQVQITFNPADLRS